MIGREQKLHIDFLLLQVLGVTEAHYCLITNMYKNRIVAYDKWLRVITTDNRRAV